ncbi:hypothetical protein SDC9_127824 [bioreactor metagenome]|uniref:DUF4234 domain-containing protein n=1 Tax=bioreactor metagenome TaxID=1076179 RepID=A0A645CV51_9ZZZZ
MKGVVRNPILVVVLSVVTCGIYALYWMYCVRQETKEYLEDPSVSPGLELLLVIICFPFLYVWYYKMGRDLVKMQEKAGLPANDQSILYLILAFFALPVVGNYIIQDNLNEIWNRQE